MTFASGCKIAQVVVDVPSRALDGHFDYAVTDPAMDVAVGSCVLVELGSRPVIGYVVGVADTSDVASLKPLMEVLDRPCFSEASARLARWIASEYAAPLTDAVRLFAPPGGRHRVVREQRDGGFRWVVKAASVGPVDDRWAELGPHSNSYTPSRNATSQRAVLEAVSQGPVRVAEIAADLGGVEGAIRRLAEVGALTLTRRRRIRGSNHPESPAPRPASLTAGQRDALEAVAAAAGSGGGVVLLDGVTGSGKTEVYLQAIESTLDSGRTAIVLVPEISLTPQTVGRFRARFGEDVAVLHSRLSAGERYDQWTRARDGEARIVVGARSALFAPLASLGLIVIDEEHEGSYKQGSSPRYHAREVAEAMAEIHGAVLVLGSASPSLDSRVRAVSHERWTRVAMPERVTGRPLPAVEVVDMGAEFAAGHRSMFSRSLAAGLRRVMEAGEKAVLLLNRRGFAACLLCRECGFVPSCDLCSISLTFHEVGRRLSCHHCGSRREVPAVCPRCSSPYLRMFGAGTQRVEAELSALVPGLEVVRMDADTTRGKGGHERLLASFEALDSGVLLGTQMIAKGLDYPDVTLVGVISADLTLSLPDFRAGERTYQLLEQVSGRAGRGQREGRVVIQTYWPDHPAVRAAAAHDPSAYYDSETTSRLELGYPPYGRLANVLVWGPRRETVGVAARDLAAAISEHVHPGWSVLGPSPCPLERINSNWRMHILVKAPQGAPLGETLSGAARSLGRLAGVYMAIDVDPVDLL